MIQSYAERSRFGSEHAESEALKLSKLRNQRIAMLSQQSSLIIRGSGFTHLHALKIDLIKKKREQHAKQLQPMNLHESSCTAATCANTSKENQHRLLPIYWGAANAIDPISGITMGSMHTQADRSALRASSGAGTGTSSSRAACNPMSLPHRCKRTPRHVRLDDLKGRALGPRAVGPERLQLIPNRNTRIAETEFAAGGFFQLQA